MTTLLLTTDAPNGFNRLTITPTAAVTGIRRSDANGSVELRTMTGQLPHAAPAVLLLDDYEASEGTSTYTVTTTAGTVSGSIVLALESPWIGTPEAPQFSAAVPAVLGYGAGGSTRSTVHEPDGRGDAVVIVMGGAKRRGTMTVQGGTYATALALFGLCQRGQTLMLRQTDHAGMDMYFLPLNWDIVTSRTDGAASEFDLDIQYLEVGRPAGALAGALGWTWDELLATYPSWNAQYAAYSNWGNVRTDTRKAS